MNAKTGTRRLCAWHGDMVNYLTHSREDVKLIDFDTAIKKQVPISLSASNARRASHAIVLSSFRYPVTICKLVKSPGDKSNVQADDWAPVL